MTGASPTLTLTPLNVAVPVQPGQSLLQAAEAAGLNLPALCRNGTCRECMARCTAGSVRYRVDWPGLLAEEKAEGWVLPCVAEPITPVTLHQPGATRVVAQFDAQP